MTNHTLTPELLCLSTQYDSKQKFSSDLYSHYHVKRGLRDQNGHGVLVGLTEISEVNGQSKIDGVLTPIPGELYYRGYDIHDLIEGIKNYDHWGYEETLFTLLFGDLPTNSQLSTFLKVLVERRELPHAYVKDILMMAPSHDIMNMMSRSVLTLYSYDDYADDTSTANLLRQSLDLISLFPSIAVYSYIISRHHYYDENLFLHKTVPTLSTAENFLHLLREDGNYTPSEAKLLDICLILHMEHGGGNNSTFTTHLISSTGTDSYSAVAGALGSLKGPKHGGANKKVSLMMAELKKKVKNWTDETEIKHYLEAIVNGIAFDHSGLIYGIGHPVYSISDPRAVLLKNYAHSVSVTKDRVDEYELYSLVAKLAPKVICEKHKIFKPLAANIDFYSGFIYSLLDIPLELYTPLFAIGRIAGWSAHRMEEINYNHKVMRPAFMGLTPHKKYIQLSQR